MFNWFEKDTHRVVNVAWLTPYKDLNNFYVCELVVETYKGTEYLGQNLHHRFSGSREDCGVVINNWLNGRSIFDGESTIKMSKVVDNDI